MNKRILTYFYPYKFYLFITLFSSIIVAGVNLLIPLVVKNLIDKVLIQKNLFMLNIISIFIIVIFLVKGLFFYIENYFSQKIALNITTELKKELYSHIIALPFGYFKNKHSGDVTSYIINDLNLIQSTFTISLFNGILDLIIVIGSIIFLFVINFRLALLSFILIPLLVFIVNYIGRFVKRITIGIQTKLAELTSHLGDSLSGISIIFTFSTQNREKQKFNKIADDIMELSLKDTKLKSILPPLVEFFLSLGLTLVLWYGGRDVVKGNMSSGDLIAFLGYLVLASSPLTRLSNSYYSIKKIQGAFKRIFELLDIEEVTLSQKGNLILNKIKGKVEFKNICFSYGEKSIFNNLNLTIHPGEKIALVGPNGEGKSTFLHLILRLYDPIDGDIFIDGINIKKMNINFLRSHIGIVLQDTYLFSGTIYENITYGLEDISDKRMENILTMLKFDEILKKFPNGINSKVGEGGIKLSGGERQRISLARTLILDPEILLLDEPTSSLDPSSRKEFQSFLSKIMKGRTTIFVSHYREEIEMADRIFLIKNGSITYLKPNEIDEFFKK